MSAGMPASAEIPASGGLDDVVFRRARAEPGAVMLRRRAPWGGWQEVTAGQFRAEVTALARGISPRASDRATGLG